MLTNNRIEKIYTEYEAEIHSFTELADGTLACIVHEYLPDDTTEEIEQAGYDILFYGEQVMRCESCNEWKLINLHSYDMYVTFTGETILQCCFQDNIDTLIYEMMNNPEKALPSTVYMPEEWKKWNNDTRSSGMHAHCTDDPVVEYDSLKEHHPQYDFIFKIVNASMFETEYDIYYKQKEQ